MDTNLLEEITIFQDNEENFINIFAYFNSKIRYLAYKLRYPEAETDLIIYLYELLKSLNSNKFEKEQDIVAYINRCLKNRSILLYYKDFKDKELMSFTSETEILDVIDINDRSDEYSDIRFNDLISILKPKQKEITFYKFYMQFSDVEIAKMLKISRQAVNKTQRLALRNLKTQLSI